MTGLCNPPPTAAPTPYHISKQAALDQANRTQQSISGTSPPAQSPATVDRDALPPELRKKFDAWHRSQLQIPEKSLAGVLAENGMMNEGWASWLRESEATLNTEQKKLAIELIESHFVATPNEMEHLLKSPDSFECGQPVQPQLEALNEQEKTIQDKLLAMVGSGRTDEVISYLQTLNKTSISKASAYILNQEIRDQAINLGKIFRQLFISTPSFRETLVQQLYINLTKVNINNQPEVLAFFNSIPSREIYDELCRRDSSAKIPQMLEANWMVVRPALGHIFFVEDKLDYFSRLQSQADINGLAMEHTIQLERFKPYHVPLEIIDLHSGQKKFLDMSFVQGQDNRLLISVTQENGAKINHVINPDDLNSVKAWGNLVVGESRDYQVLYYPKIHTQPGGTPDQARVVIDMQYASADGSPENAILKRRAEQAADNGDKPKAMRIFREAYQSENGYLQESMAAMQPLSDVRAKMQQEPPIEIEKLLRLMQNMDGDSLLEEITKTFKISKEAWSQLKDKATSLLKTKTNMTPDEFLREVIIACEGRAMLASYLAYSVTASFSKNHHDLFVQYPQAFHPMEGTRDQSGAIYHYLGCCFIAYATQISLIDRYHTDPKFKMEIDQKQSDLLAKIRIITGKIDLTEEQLMLLTQYTLLKNGDKDQKEILSLAGIFQSEVGQGETSQETVWDTRGMAMGHALFEYTTGSKLQPSSSTRDLVVDAMEDRLDGKTIPRNIMKLLRLAPVDSLRMLL